MKIRPKMLSFSFITLFSSVSVFAQSEQQPLDTNQDETKSNQIVTEVNGKILIQDTIRGNREQPRVLSIVPWQPPRDKASLPSPFVKRIEQDFMPLDREEFTRKVEHFERATGKK
ncbi:MULTISPECIES: hypothetical protein [Aliiglaciecola]|uniref:hypothetical protein n=1 Tax=Aliiglaciecola TaxID=1406885 RepID=UPI001C092590|nr:MULTISPECIES: hypothetical protein [Aliiglaciecola]MBU2877239.1 hypothetical protein [Aliiglaciecola lipolytica]MDO6712060.1 hypothetical protein [Aliiglaciecola sp. 2_MG-2023]MDO6754373.1 hypothetical protein [Aliiglaciecola sp. 1_MG-2023]